MSWVWLLIAGLLEIVWVLGLKYSDGFTRLGPSAVTIVALIASLILLMQSLKGIPTGTAYAAWMGIGAVGTAIVGIILFKEPATVARLACIGLILAGIIGLKLTTA
jgi:quaternary ammonium compound-resistance protein SugE